jgi:hypothetical protein
MKSRAVSHLFVIFTFLCFASEAIAGVPLPPLSTCTVTITQYRTRTACITNWEPDVVRLTPAGSATHLVVGSCSCTRLDAPYRVRVQSRATPPAYTQRLFDMIAQFDSIACRIDSLGYRDDTAVAVAFQYTAGDA